jgi:hypothetical protein
VCVSRQSRSSRHPDLSRIFFRFKHIEEGKIEGLTNICCMRGKWNSFNVVFTQKPEFLGNDMSAAASVWNSPRCRDVWNKVMANETFKNRAIDVSFDIALDKEILVWTVSTLISIIRNLAQCDNYGEHGVPADLQLAVQQWQVPQKGTSLGSPTRVQHRRMCPVEHLDEHCIP